MKIVVLCGGLSMERNVSITSGTLICKSLRALGHQAVLVDMWQAIVSNPLSQGISLREISGFLQAALPESVLNQLDAQLAKIPVE